MKFPKDEVVIINKIKEYLSNEDYIKIYHMKPDILNFLKDNYSNLVIDKENVGLDGLIIATYYLENPNGVIMIGDEYMKYGYESFSTIYYMLLSFLCNNDIYQAVNFIHRSKILNQADIKAYYNNDEANYSLIGNINDLYKSLSLILVNFVYEISKEQVIVNEITKDYLLYRFFDVINLMNEIGYSFDVIDKLSNDIRNVFLK